ncbi:MULTISPECIES: hypothetical protein [unclassified Sulfuricurvum]|nr:MULTISPECIES: hypothetical protein [unclassified Sulfuricurvum]AFV97429.1 hypothetical protein B649_05575 [Candidatus Sulfuricurvum sp. RIFRC-1]
MSTVNYLLVALSISAVVYVFYRYVFLKSPKKELPHKPHFTLKIESE